MNNSTTEPNSESIFDEVKPLPVYYSEKAIYGFSILCGVLFGSVLLAMNINQKPEKNGLWQVIAFGAAFTAIQITIASFIPKENSSIIWFISIAGGQFLKNFMWGKYLGKDCEYTKRSILIPGIIGVCIIGLFVWAIISALP